MFFLGLMSGTSLDGIDAALIKLKESGSDRVEECTLLSGLTRPWQADLRKKLLGLSQNQADVSIDMLGHLDAEVGISFAHAANQLIKKVGIAPSRIAAIGSHGQTIRHRPDATLPFSIQIGDAHRIAEITGITTISDFRRRDIAAGGQGAPLMPAFHQAMLQDKYEDRAVLNLGGIANLTLIPANGPVRGFDCGPANALLDCWYSKNHANGALCDHLGQWAASGKICQQFLAHLCADTWFGLSPPKSTGRDYFNLDWLIRRLQQWLYLKPEDVQATLVALTVRTISDALQAYQPSTIRLYVAGGGCHNRFLMEQLALALSHLAVEPISSTGLDPDFLESMGFAWLAAQTLRRVPGNLPNVTGAKGSRILGSIHIGSIQS